ncbi:MAG TPA: cell surface protein SprA, partial [Fibrobacteres bacterium]|nr:cell surface protein SprA [Fibrobacterota bacterium]
MTKRIYITVLYGFFAFYSEALATDLQYQQPVIEIFHPPGSGEYQGSFLTEPNPSYLIPKTTIIEEHQVVDFEQRAVSFERVDKAFGVVIWQYRYDEMDAYISDRKKFAFGGLWNRCAQDRFKAAADSKKAFNPLQMQLNIQYPTWAQRILGKDPPKLSITGYEELIVAYEYSKTDAVGSNYDTKGTGGISFDQNNQFTVTGSVGKVINVNIKASTKSGVDVDASDPFKNFKIEYKGENNELEDEVVQEVLAGSVSFQMPGASLAGYSESHQGLLGLEVKTKFGPLELTAIASQERGEAQTTTFDLSSGSSGNSVITEKQFVAYKMFFLDTMYRNYYLNRKATIPDAKKINRKKLQIWLHTSSTSTDKKNATLKTKYTFCYLDSKDGEAYKLLTENKDYTVSDLIPGCIRFDSVTISETDKIGICMMTTDGSLVKGDTGEIALLDTTIVKSNLWMLKNENPLARDSNFVLAWRNVYSLSSDFDVSKFKLSVKRIPESGDTTDRVGSNLFSYILGLTDNTGAPYSTNNNIYVQDANLLIIPRFAVDSSTWSNRPFSNSALNGTSGTDNTNPGVDTLTDASFSELKAKYNIIMSGSAKKTSLQLGSGNIEENSEKVTGQDGEVLTRDQDYTLDYQYGTLQLTSKKAQAKTKITVQYQSEALFVPKSKTFLGLHGEMKLPIGINSFVGGSILYQNASSSSNIPKIGQEPYSKVLLDANTKMNFEPQWMTEIMDLVPFLSTEDKSSASIDIEIAHSRTNPNTDGQSYIDDFESSNKSYDFPLEGASWYMAAPPAYLVSGSGDSSLLHCPPAWTQWWYEPVSTDAGRQDMKVIKDSMLFKVPSKSTYSSTDKYETTLNFECQPAPPNKTAQQELYQRYDKLKLNPWAGITYPIPTASMNRSKDKYLEFYAKGDGGRLYIDLGEVSEDVCYLGGPPNGKTGDEDTTGTGTSAYNEYLDVGLDGLHDTNEYYLVPNDTGWDTLIYNDSRLPYPKDPARDNYQTYSISISDHSEYKDNYPYANGTEKNGKYDSKDLLGDGLSTAENYFRRFIDFDSVNNKAEFSANAHNYQVLPDSSAGNAEAANGWHLYRIPLNDSVTGIFQKKNSALWTRIKFVRLFWTDFNEDRRFKANRIQFARMRLVRNEWQEHPIKLTDSTTTVKMTAKTINTEDNPEYTSPPGFSIQNDDNGNREKESALDLTFTNIKPADTAMVHDILVNETINLSKYTNMSMWVHGDTMIGT